MANRSILIIFSSLVFATFISCIDTEVLPYDITTSEDMWKTREDVQAMVAGAYEALTEADAIAMMIVWGDFRSDDMTLNAQTTIDNSTMIDLKEVYSLSSFDDRNMYCNWLPFYTVINRCNQVLEKAPGVMELDPSYTESTYNTDKSQMLALRALAYFWLVRTFRDVPYTPNAYYNSSQDDQVPQSPPGEVLDKCIADLEEALATPLSPTAYSDWRKTGLINKEAINALLADVYIWKASLTDNPTDYEAAIIYCDNVIESKKQNAPTGMGSNIMDGDYPLIEGARAYSEIFSSGNGNSSESIFELNMGSNSNTSVLKYFFTYTGETNDGYIEAPIMFDVVNYPSSGDGSSSTGIYLSLNDYRPYRAIYNPTATDYAHISKYVHPEESTGGAGSTLSYIDKESYNDIGGSSFNRNWIFYRLTDIMLLKAEALVWLAEENLKTSGGLDSIDQKLISAFDIVKAVNDRSLSDASDELTMPDTKVDMEYLVLGERQRELCFEGKRWFDLLRFNYRHKSPADIYSLMSECTASEIYDDMLNLMIRKYSEGGSTMKSKYSSKKEFVFYFPIYYDEIKSNTMLKQNPLY